MLMIWLSPLVFWTGAPKTGICCHVNGKTRHEQSWLISMPFVLWKKYILRTGIVVNYVGAFGFGHDYNNAINRWRTKKLKNNREQLQIWVEIVV